MAKHQTTPAIRTGLDLESRAPAGDVVAKPGLVVKAKPQARRGAARHRGRVVKKYGTWADRWQSRITDWFAEHPEETRGWLASLFLHALILLFIGLTFWLPQTHIVSPFDVVVVDDLDQEAGREDGFEDGLNLVGAGLEAPAGDPLEKWNVAGGSALDAAANSEGAELGSLRSALDASALVVEDNDDEELEPVPAGSGNKKGKTVTGTVPGGGKGPGKEAGANVAGLLDGRGDEARARLVKKGGGTKETERAVQLGLDWLARHQQSDGSWSFQHGPDDPGYLVCPTGATGLALLAFLGAGNTHQKGRYSNEVSRGLNYLLRNLEETNQGGWLQGTGIATMYVQGICTTALCEAYTMSKDEKLRRPAQLAVDFIVNAQDPEGGGWRYRVPQAGDTSVVGWQVMALTSARIAELKIHPRVLPKVSGFLQRVQANGGGYYGYTHPGSVRNSTTAVGLLCRMYLGREQTNRGLIRGMKNLSNWGPNSWDMYYSYYGTMAMHHWGGAQWERWNNDMRKALVDSQEQEGDAAGSWPTDRSVHADTGGRLYTTCLSILTLEVYYRYLPIYKRPASVTDDPDGDLQKDERQAEQERE
jgi:hypothetical protein